MFESVEFESQGAVLRGRLYPGEIESSPYVVMTHGTSATITMIVDKYAEEINRAGFNVLLFDHRNFGISDGEPRFQINPWIQGRGYRDAVAWLRDQKGAQKIAIWGDSFSAMIVLVVGALIPGLSAIVAQIPACGIELPSIEPSDETFSLLQETFENSDVGGTSETTTGPLPVVSPDQFNNPSLLAPIQAYRWFIEHGGKFGSHWVNEVTRAIPPTPVPFSAYLAAPYIEAPVLMMTGKDDEMIHCNPEVQRAVFSKIKASKEHCEMPDGHFGILWHPSELFDQAAAKQVSFLRDKLLDS